MPAGRENAGRHRPEKGACEGGSLYSVRARYSEFGKLAPGARVEAVHRVFPRHERVDRSEDEHDDHLCRRVVEDSEADLYQDRKSVSREEAEQERNRGDSVHHPNYGGRPRFLFERKRTLLNVLEHLHEMLHLTVDKSYDDYGESRGRNQSRSNTGNPFLKRASLYLHDLQIRKKRNADYC